MSDVFAGLSAPLRDRPGDPIGGRTGLRPDRARKLFGLPEVATPWNLTPAQVAVLQLCSEGRSNGEIAEALGISQKTVEAHLQNTFERITKVIHAPVGRVRAAVLWDRFTRGGAAQ